MQEEINKKLDEMAAAGFFDKFFLPSVINVLWFDGVKNDGTPCQAPLQAAIDTAEAGNIVVFPRGTYSFDSLKLKSNVRYDFNGSTLEFTAAVGLHAEGELLGTQTMPNGYAAGSTTLTFGTSAYVTPGCLLHVVNKSELAVSSRPDYYKGFTCLVESVNNTSAVVSAGVPYAIGSVGIQCEVYAPAENIIVENVGGLVCTGSITSRTFGMQFQQCKNVIVRACSGTVTLGAYANLWQCCQCEVSGMRVSMQMGSATTSYMVEIQECTNTRVENCIASSQWSCLSTTGETTVIGTSIFQCDFTALGETHSCGDHDNTLDTVLDTCKLDGMKISCNARAVNCDVYPFNNNLLIQIAPCDTYDYSDCILENCRFHGTATNSIPFSYIAVTTVSTTEVAEFYMNSVTLKNCQCLGFPRMYVGAQTVTHLRNLNIDSCKGIYYYGANDTFQTYPVEHLRIENWEMPDNAPIFLNLIKVNTATLRNIVLKPVITYGIRVNPGVSAVIDGVSYESGDYSVTGKRCTIENLGNLTLANVDMSNLEAAQTTPLMINLNFANSNTVLNSCKCTLTQPAIASCVLNGEYVDLTGTRNQYAMFNDDIYKGTFNGTDFTWAKVI